MSETNKILEYQKFTGGYYNNAPVYEACPKEEATHGIVCESGEGRSKKYKRIKITI